ncbi:aminoglycoside phosphotransferase family protein [Brevibacillus humidisoli]|uniref:phosphotransferase n=1 Tax=Brevibacillus humidisoli TaxID=2895522 RepID=UPI001E346E99|nr:aminoglycoside phosphotransferase family protein [Brevibacillus humidisoli]
MEEAERAVVARDQLQRLDVAKQKPKLEANIEKMMAHGLWPRDRRLSQFLASLQPVEADARLAVVHGDLHIRNVLVDEQGLRD